MLLIENVGHIGLTSLTDGILGRHLEYFKTLNDARVASVGFINYNASTTRINKEKTLKSSSRSFCISTGLFYVNSFETLHVFLSWSEVCMWFANTPQIILSFFYKLILVHCQGVIAFKESGYRVCATPTGLCEFV